MQIQFIPVCAENRAQIETLSAFATEIVRAHFDPIIGEAQNTYMLSRFQSAEGIREQIRHGSRYYIAADQDEKWMGFMAFYPKGKEMYLSKFYVHAAHRGKGVARQMFSFLTEMTREEDLHRISLNVNRDNELAIGVYLHLGFVLARTEQNAIGEGFMMDDHVYEYDC